jgi:hypothetical protein
MNSLIYTFMRKQQQRRRKNRADFGSEPQVLQKLQHGIGDRESPSLLVPQLHKCDAILQRVDELISWSYAEARKYRPFMDGSALETLRLMEAHRKTIALGLRNTYTHLTGKRANYTKAASNMSLVDKAHTAVMHAEITFLKQTLIR